MTRLAWYKRDPAAFLDGTMALTLEETGAYAKVLELIYVRDGACPDNERWIAGHLNCDVRTWRRLRGRLIELGKLYLDGETLRNAKADSTIASGLDRLEQTITAGRRSGEKRRKSGDKPSNFNGSGGTSVPTGAATTEREIKTQKEKKESYPAAAEPVTPAHAREEAAAAPDGFADLVDALHERVAPAGVTRRGVQRVVEGWAGQIGEARTRTVVAEALACATGNTLKYAAAIVDRRSHALDVGKHAASLPLPEEPDVFLDVMLRPAAPATNDPRRIGRAD